MGHKMHIESDTNGIIKKVIATKAKNHDNARFYTLTEDKENIFICVNTLYLLLVDL